MNNTENEKNTQVNKWLELIFETKNINVESIYIILTKNKVTAGASKIQEYTGAEHDSQYFRIEFDAVEISKIKNMSTLELVTQTQLSTRIQDMLSYYQISSNINFEDRCFALQLVVTELSVIRNLKKIDSKYNYTVKDDSKNHQYTVGIYKGKRDGDGKVLNKRNKSTH